MFMLIYGNDWFIYFLPGKKIHTIKFNINIYHLLFIKKKKIVNNNLIILQID